MVQTIPQMVTWILYQSVEHWHKSNAVKTTASRVYMLLDVIIPKQTGSSI